MLQITIGTPTSRRIQKARTARVLEHPFFGSILFRLKDCECRSIQTMATNGVSLYYNPDSVETLNAATLAGTLAHEAAWYRNMGELIALWGDATLGLPCQVVHSGPRR